MRQVLIFKRPDCVSFSLFFFSLSLFLSLCYPASADSSCACRPGVSFDLARATTRLPPSLLLLLAAAAFVAHRYCCLNGGSPPVLGTCFTADTRLLLLLPARYTACVPSHSLLRAQRSFPSRFEMLFERLRRSENFPVWWTNLIKERSAC